MYCVIQQVMLKKPNKYGAYKEIRAYQNQWRIAGDNRPLSWAWEYTGGRFDRPHLEAFKITLHQSCREGGVVKKKQYSVCTMSYYDLCNDCGWWGDCIVGGDEALAGKVGITADELLNIIEAKVGPLRERLEAEFQQSAEYQTMQEHRRILDTHKAAVSAFCKKYGVEGEDYSRCYDVFGVLRNPDYLKQIKSEHKARKQSERSYREQWRSTYEQYTSGSYSIPSSSTYNDDDRAILKKFYKELSKRFHPDLNPGTDTTAQMQLLNRLKEQWGI